MRKGVSHGLLKPIATLFASGNRAEVGDLYFRKPCWVSDKFRCRLRYGRSNLSRTMIAGQRREISRYEVPWWRGLPTLGIVILLACFHIEEVSADCMERLKSLVRY